MRPARLFHRTSRPNHTLWVLRAGRLGRGRVLHTIEVWDANLYIMLKCPEQMMQEIARREGFEIVTGEEVV